MKPSGIGGQAVIEGVMMKNQDVYAIAVRKPDNSIEIKNEEYTSIQKKYAFTKLPIIRGVVSFVESMVIGMKTLTYSASFFEEEEVKTSKLEEKFGKVFKEKAESVIMGLTVLLSILLAVGVFMILPFFIAEAFKKLTDNTTLLAVIEGLIRIIIFIAYAIGISFMKDIKRVFMYHGAEHKTINCIENGLPLTVKNVRNQSKHHKRCGTSFMLVVMFVTIIFFIFIRVDNVWLRMLYRILLVPVIAGVSYEFIRLAGKSESAIVNILSKPGMWMQSLTTREPEDSMIEVAIASVEAVFDWKKYQEEGSTKKKTGKSKEVKSKEVKSNENKSKENKLSENKSNEIKLNDNKSNDNKSNEIKSNVVKSKNVKPNENKSNENKSNENKSNENKSNENKSKEIKLNETKPKENVENMEVLAKKTERKEDKIKENKSEKIEKVSEPVKAASAETAATKEEVKVAKKATTSRSRVMKDEAFFRVKPDTLAEDEEDEILSALDKFFVFEDEKKEP